MATSFVLHPQLELDTIPLGTYPLCRVLLMNDANYPWLIAVPQRANISEIYQLKDVKGLRSFDEVYKLRA